jgi:hypothetical protein
MNQNQLREYLFQQDLEHEKQMDRIIKDAQPKKINEDYKIKLMKPPIITRDLIGPEYMAEKQLLDLSLDLQMQNTIKQAMYALDGKTPEPMKGSVTEEMIADYKKEVMKPVEIGGKFHLYRPVEIPPLVKPADTPYHHGGLKISEAAYQRRRQYILEDIAVYQDDLQRAQAYRKTLADRFTFTSSSIYDEAAERAYLNSLSRDEIVKRAGFAKSKQDTAALINRIVNRERIGKPRAADLTPIEDELNAVDADIRDFIIQIRRENALFAALKANYEQQDAVDEENRLKKIEYDNKKRQLTQEVLSDFNRLNQGKIEVTRQSNETDDEFIARLQQMGNIFIDPADMAKQIETEILMKAKKNILELTSDYGKAESVTRMLNNNERFQMNKAFPMIKKEYSEKFGINNKNLDDTEITQFIKNKIETGLSLIKEAPEAPAAQPKTEAELTGLKAQMRQFTKSEFEQIIDEFNDENPQRNLRKGTVKEMVIQLNAANLYDAKKFRTMLKTPDANVSTFPIELPKLQSEEQVRYNQLREAAERAEGFVEDDEDDLDGGGIKNYVLPSSVTFGKIALDLNKLFYQNILSIKRHNGNKIIGHKNKRVSDNFVDIIMKMFDDKSITQSDLRNIKDEQMLYDNLIVQSGLHKLKKIPTNIEQTSEQMKNRLGLLTGEIEAGNSNKSLLTELHELLFKMVRVHLISKNAAAAYYKNIKDQFFTL